MKRKILLCWNYERRNWVSRFEEIFEKGGYVFINFFSKELEKTSSTSEKVYYWNDFKSVDHLIEVIKPEKVIFMGLDSPYVFLLNHACREKGIITFFLQHGIFHSYKAYMYEEQSMRSLQATAGANSILTKAIAARNNAFFFHSFRIRRIGLYYRIIKFLVVKKNRSSTQMALRSIAHKILQPDYYIVYTKYLSNIFIERDNISEDKMIEIGNDEADQLILEIQNTPGYSYDKGDYFLFIDEAFTGSAELLLPPIVSIEKYNEFLLLLSVYARSKGKRLRVKLHPFSYNVDHFVTDDNIDYIKHANFRELIVNACGVFGFSSTLLIPAMFVKKACIFKLNNFSDIHRALNNIGYCRVLDFHHLKLTDIEFNDNVSATQREAFISHFLFKLDNECTNRLKKILRGN